MTYTHIEIKSVVRFARAKRVPFFCMRRNVGRKNDLTGN